MSTLDDIRITELEPARCITIRETVAFADMVPFFDRAFTALAGALAEQGLTPVGAPYARYYGQPTDTIDIEAGIAVVEEPSASDTVSAGSLPGGRAATATMSGSYDGLGAAWGAMFEWIQARGESPADTMWEVYVTEPTPDMDPAELRTELYWPLV